MPAERRYRAAPPDALACVPLDALTLVYDCRSAQTHLLATPLPEILAAMGGQWWRISDFAAHLAAEFDLTGDSAAEAPAADQRAVIAARLHELAQLGLVEAR